MTQRHGFHLIELIVVTVVVATALAVAVPRLSDGQGQYRLDLSTRQIASDIEQTREAAMYESRSKSITFDPVASTYFSWDGNPTAVGGDLQAEDVQEVSEQTLVTTNEVLTIDAVATPIHRVVRTSPAVRVVYSASDAPLARQIMLAQSPFRATLIGAEFGGGRTLSFNGFGRTPQGGAVNVSVGKRASVVAVDELTGAVTVSRLTLSETTELLLEHTELLLSSTARTADDLLGTGTVVEDTVGIVTGTTTSLVGGTVELLSDDQGSETTTTGTQESSGGLIGGLLGILGG